MGTRATIAASLLAFAAFALLTLLVEMQWLTGIDLVAAQAKAMLAGELLDRWSRAARIAVSAQLSVVYAGMAGLLLWRAGAGRWSLAPLAFLLPTVLEVVLKSTIRETSMPLESLRVPYFPAITLSLNGSFPSGHALRGAFFCTFAAALLWQRGSRLARSASLGFLLLALLLGLARVYGGDHWLSDVVAGLLLGAAAALLVAPPVARRLSAPRGG